MDPISAAGIGKAIAGPALSWASGEALKRLREQPLDRAIRETDAAFPELGGVAEQLGAWIEHDSFGQALDSYLVGQRDLVDIRLVRAFIDSTSFHHPDDTERWASNVLRTFLSYLERALLQSDYGHEVQVARMEVVATEMREATSLNFESVQAKLDQIIAQTTDGNRSGLQQEEKANVALDQSRILIRSGQYRAARAVIEQVTRELPTDASGALRARIALNLGACALYTGENAEADEQFNIALQAQPDDPKPMINMAVWQLVQGDGPAALNWIRRARELAGDDGDAAAVYLEALHATSSDAQVDEFLDGNAWALNNSHVLASLGLIREDQGRHVDAEALYLEAERFDGEDPSLPALRGAAILSQLLPDLQINRPLPWQMDPTLSARLREAEQLFSHAIQRVAGRDRSPSIRMIHVNRSAARPLLGDHAGALQDIDSVLADEPTNELALRNKGIILIASGRGREAIEPLEAIRSPADKRAVAGPLAEAYRAAGRLSDARAILQQLWSDADPAERIELAGPLTRVLIDIGDDAAIGSVLSDLATEFPDHPRVMSLIAFHKSARGDFEHAIEILRKAGESAQGALRGYLSIQLGEALLSCRSYADAADVLKEIATEDAELQVQHEYAAALINSGRFKEAMGFAQRVRTDGPPVSGVSDAEALALEQIDDLAGARKIWEDLATVDERNGSHRLRAASLALRQGDPDAARELLRKTSPASISADPIALRNAAVLSAHLNEPGAIELAYRALRLAPNDPETHLAYIALTMFGNVAASIPPPPETVELDATVRLRRGDEIRTVTIVPPADARPDHDEFAPNDTIARALMGKRAGEVAVLKDAPLERIEYEIVPSATSTHPPRRKSSNSLRDGFLNTRA